MATPDDGEAVELPCGERVPADAFDLGMREYGCACGASHAVVTDAHPPERFLPGIVVETLREAVETTSEEMPEFGTPHLLGLVVEEFPGEMAVAEVTDDPDLGYALLWVSEFDSRDLHETIVELVVEVMEHAVSHAEDDDAVRQFESSMLDFDVAEFVERYRAERDLSADDVRV
ncbi:MAG: hypothetical protein A07HB70_02263 [uncultured archaeon A07HB70]|nr:MAG: hypothetical protein A07HB70_02263 [uncultured archaeon A07HB70]